MAAAGAPAPIAAPLQAPRAAAELTGQALPPPSEGKTSQAIPRPVYHPAAQHQYEGSKGGTRNAATAFTKAAHLAAASPLRPPPPPPPCPRLGGSHGGPTASTHFRTVIRLSIHREQRRVLRHACVFVS